MAASGEYWADRALAMALAAAVHADAAEERGAMKEARKHARRAGDVFAVAGEEYLLCARNGIALDCLENAVRCYRRGMSWRKARLVAASRDVLAAQIPLCGQENYAATRSPS